MGDLRAIEVDQYYPHAPALVWRTLTEPALIAEWLMPNDFEPRVGHRYTLRTTPVPSAGFTGVIACEVLELVPERLLRISWEGSGLATTVTWTLHPEGRGTRMLLRHDGFDPDDPSQLHSFRIMSGGWRSHVLRRLTEVLERVSVG